MFHSKPSSHFEVELYETVWKELWGKIFDAKNCLDFVIERGQIAPVVLSLLTFLNNNICKSYS